MRQFFGGLGKTWLIVIVVVVVALAAGGIYWATTGVFQARNTGGGVAAPDRFDNPGSREANNAVVEHTAIISAILKCHDVYDINAIVEGQQPILHTGHTFAPASSAKQLPLNGTDIAVAYLSKTLLTQRADTADVLDAFKNQMIVWQWIVIISGAAATILVSLTSRGVGRSKEDVHQFFPTLAVLAVIASATATALSSMSTFIDAPGHYTNNLKTLLALRQLHGEIATIFPSEYDASMCNPNAAADKEKQISNDIQQWASRLSDIEGGPPSANGTGEKSSSKK